MFFDISSCIIDVNKYGGEFEFMTIKFEFLKAGNGDCILISIGDNDFNILIDGGEKGTYNKSSILNLRDKIKIDIRDKGKFLDLVVITHYDGDHIGGIIKLLEEEEKNIKNGKKTIIKELWFNTFDKALIEAAMINPKTAAKDQIQFDVYLKKILDEIETYQPIISINKITKPQFIGNNKEVEIILLSPNDEKLNLLYTKDFESYIDKKSIAKDDYSFSIEELKGKRSAEDGSHRNGSSIAFILIYDRMKFLFLGDAHIGLIINSLKKLDKKYFNEVGLIEFEFVKLSHHGSSENIDEVFLDLIKTDKYIISTSGVSHNHPHKKTIVDIVSHKRREKLDTGEYKDKIEFLCNYDHKGKVFSIPEQRKYQSPFKLLSRDIKGSIQSSFYKKMEYKLL